VLFLQHLARFLGWDAVYGHQPVFNQGLQTGAGEFRKFYDQEFIQPLRLLVTEG
jgi:hypothetical protein